MDEPPKSLIDNKYPDDFTAQEKLDNLKWQIGYLKRGIKLRKTKKGGRVIKDYMITLLEPICYNVTKEVGESMKGSAIYILERIEVILKKGSPHEMKD